MTAIDRLFVVRNFKVFEYLVFELIFFTENLTEGCNLCPTFFKITYG